MNLAAFAQAILANSRELRASLVKPGSEQERAWQHLVPNPEHRATAQPLPETKPAPAEDINRS